MAYVKRDESNNITGYAKWPADGYEQIADDSEELLGFLDPDSLLSDVEIAKREKQAQIDADYEAAVNQLFAGYSASQRDSFAKQETQARSFIANPDESRTDLPMLKALADARGGDSETPMSDQAARIIAKADAAEPLFGTILGTKQAREDALLAATTLAQVEAV